MVATFIDERDEATASRLRARTSTRASTAAEADRRADVKPLRFARRPAFCAEDITKFPLPRVVAALIDNITTGEEDMKPVRAAIYHRVSTLDQDQAGAREELRAATIARGMIVALEVEETGSGARNDRPGLTKIMTAARGGKIDAVLVRHLDRFGRSALDLLANIQILEDAGVRFIAVAQSLDIKPNGDAMSKLILTVLSGVAAFERELIRERTRLGLAKARQSGKLLGRRVDHDAPAPHVVKALRSSGRSWSSIAAQLSCTSSAARRALARVAEKGVVGKPCK